MPSTSISHAFLPGDLLPDLRLAIRGLSRAPVFTVVAISSLAIALALAASTVSVVNAYLIRSLPYPNADRLYHVRYAPPGPWEPSGMTGLDWTSVKDAVEYPIAASGESFYLTEGGYTVSLRGLRVTPGFVDGLGVSVLLGRRLIDQDFVAEAEPVALIGYGLFRDRFGSDPSIVGRLIHSEPESRPGRPETFRIVGVLQPGFYYGRDSRTTLDLLLASPSPVRTYMVRLREGVPPAAAQRRLTEAARHAATSPLPADWTGVELESARDRWIGGLRPILFGISMAVSLVLVIVCANVAVLMLLRSIKRQKEIAIRLALGSRWRHIMSMILMETSLICAAALAAGVALTAAVLGTLSPRIEAQLGRPAPNAAGITLDATVLLIVAGIGLVVAVALSLAPLTTWGRGLSHVLQKDARVASEGPSIRRLRSGLIAFEIAGALVLLVACGLMVRSVVTMMTTDLGFAAEGLSVSRVMLRARNYPDPAAYRLFHERFASRLSIATASTVVFSSWPPFVPPPDHLIEPDAGDTPVNGGSIAVSAGYFSTFGIRIRQGREFTPAEASTESAVAVVSEALATRLWPGGTALGRRVREIVQTPGGSTQGPWRTVVGIAADVRQTYDDVDRSDFYTPRTPDGRYGTFYVRTRTAGPALDRLFQNAAGEIDREAVISPARLLAGDDQTLSGTRFLTALATGFAGIAAFLAMLGIYGVTAYAVQQRHKEIAIRVALGASDRAVVRIFLRDGVMLLGVGTLAGLAGGAALSRLLGARIFGVESFDLPTYALASGLLVAAGCMAVFWAARKAAAANPVSALNSSE